MIDNLDVKWRFLYKTCQYLKVTLRSKIWSIKQNLKANEVLDFGDEIDFLIYGAVRSVVCARIRAISISGGSCLATLLFHAPSYFLHAINTFNLVANIVCKNKLFIL